MAKSTTKARCFPFHKNSFGNAQVRLPTSIKRRSNLGPFNRRLLLLHPPRLGHPLLHLLLLLIRALSSSKTKQHLVLKRQRGVTPTSTPSSFFPGRRRPASGAASGVFTAAAAVPAATAGGRPVALVVTVGAVGHSPVGLGLPLSWAVAAGGDLVEGLAAVVAAVVSFVVGDAVVAVTVGTPAGGVGVAVVTATFGGGRLDGVGGPRVGGYVGWGRGRGTSATLYAAVSVAVIRIT